MLRVRARLDRWLFQHPFEGGGAQRYQTRERGAFGDLDARLIAAWSPALAEARRLLDLGSGPGQFARRLAARRPGLQIIQVDPSRTFAPTLRARAEALPLSAASIDAAVLLSSIRHVRDRDRALRELRRVIAPGGVAFIVELDPESAPWRARAHARNLSGIDAWLRFPVVLRTAPRLDEIAGAALRAGWTVDAVGRDPVQPVYTVTLRATAPHSSYK